jgi:transcription antitermination factor NusG
MRGEQKSRAEIFLGHAGYETYCPRIKNRRGGEIVIAPLFAGYIFVRVVENWWQVRWTPGVVRVLMCSERPAKLPDQFIDDLRRNERGGFVRLPQPMGLFVKGASVRVLAGQFRGFIGLYEGQSSRDREIILLDLLGRKVPVELAGTDAIEIVK